MKTENNLEKESSDNLRLNEEDLNDFEEDE